MKVVTTMPDMNDFHAFNSTSGGSGGGGPGGGAGPDFGCGWIVIVVVAYMSIHFVFSGADWESI